MQLRRTNTAPRNAVVAPGSGVSPSDDTADARWDVSRVQSARVWCPVCEVDATWSSSQEFWYCIACRVNAPPKAWAELMTQRLYADDYRYDGDQDDNIAAALRGGT